MTNLFRPWRLTKWWRARERWRLREKYVHQLIVAMTKEPRQELSELVSRTILVVEDQRKEREAKNELL